MLEKLLSKKGYSILLIIGILIVAIVLGTKSGVSRNNNSTYYDLENVNVKELLTNIKDNYSLSINVINSEEKSNYNYSRDSKIELIDEGDYSDKVYLIYNKKYYLIDSNNYKIKKVSKLDIYNNPYTNIDIIRNLINICEFESVNNTNKKCTLKVDTYFNEYNSLYKTNYNGEGDISINISYFKEKIHSITIDYTNIDKIINNGNDILKYELIFSNIGTNDYSEMYNYYKKDLKK